MNRRKFIVELGMGVDQHGQDPTNAARKAVEDAISRSCLTGLIEIARLKAMEQLNQLTVAVRVACPQPERVDEERVLQALPFGQKQLEIVEGGMIAPTVYQPELGDTSDEAFIANAAVTVFVDMDRVLAAWREEQPRDASAPG
jgi:uncharacterized protein (TIGR02058 family)